MIYQCISGYHNVGKGNVSICDAAGQWEEPHVLCQGRVNLQQIKIHYSWIFRATLVGGSKMILFVVETLCENPPVSESTELRWNGSTAPGSTVVY